MAAGCHRRLLQGEEPRAAWRARTASTSLDVRTRGPGAGEWSAARPPPPGWSLVHAGDRPTSVGRCASAGNTSWCRRQEAAEHADPALAGPAAWRSSSHGPSRRPSPSQTRAGRAAAAPFLSWLGFCPAGQQRLLRSNDLTRWGRTAAPQDGRVPGEGAGVPVLLPPVYTARPASAAKSGWGWLPPRTRPSVRPAPQLSEAQLAQLTLCPGDTQDENGRSSSRTARGRRTGHPHAPGPLPGAGAGRGATGSGRVPGAGPREGVAGGRGHTGGAGARGGPARAQRPASPDRSAGCANAEYQGDWELQPIRSWARSPAWSARYSSCHPPSTAG